VPLPTEPAAAAPLTDPPDAELEPDVPPDCGTVEGADAVGARSDGTVTAGGVTLGTVT
jgi:hypothetical protein